jgi:hypothetical protein
LQVRKDLSLLDEIAPIDEYVRDRSFDREAERHRSLRLDQALQVLRARVGC